MGVKLVEYFDKCKNEFGLDGVVKLAMFTKFSSRVAAEKEDTLLLIREVEMAYQKVKTEMKK